MIFKLQYHDPTIHVNHALFSASNKYLMVEIKNSTNEQWEECFRGEDMVFERTIDSCNSIARYIRLRKYKIKPRISVCELQVIGYRYHGKFNLTHISTFSNKLEYTVVSFTILLYFFYLCIY